MLASLKYACLRAWFPFSPSVCNLTIFFDEYRLTTYLAGSVFQKLSMLAQSYRLKTAIQLLLSLCLLLPWHLGAGRGVIIFGSFFIFRGGPWREVFLE
jgi:hypothetical protein